MSIRDSWQFWKVTEAERVAWYPCHRYAVEPAQSFLRGIDIGADSDLVFRWLCQLRVAPYSYDWLDNLGRRSPRTLTPGAEDLALGQSFMIATIVEFDAGRHITGVSMPKAARIFGPITLTYQVAPTTPSTSRLVVCLTVTAEGVLQRLRRGLLGMGDLVMMRKQLLTLKQCAESAQVSRSGSTQERTPPKANRREAGAALRAGRGPGRRHASSGRRGRRSS